MATLALAGLNSLLGSSLNSGRAACSALTSILRHDAAAGDGEENQSKNQQILPNHLMTSIDKHRFVEEAT